jgi:RHS repeat-associated protein
VYSYDANGNLLSSGDRTLTWNAANKAAHLTSGTQAADFIYGADGQRVVQAIGTTGGSTLSRTVYVGLGGTGKSVYERTTRGNKIEHAHFIYAGAAHGGSALAVRTVTEDVSSPSTRTDYRYRHFDHLGSVTAESDESGHVATAAWAGSSAGIFGYDAWGARRSPDGRAADPASFSPPTGHRGFTDQEDIAGLGLVNMNGRIYDPVVGRFLSADPTVQFASNLQSYNRYSYAVGNPLKYTDPTGYNAWKDGLDGLVPILNIWIPVLSVAVCAGTAGAGCAVAFAIAAVAINATAAIASGDSWGQVLATSAVGLGAGLLFGQIGAGIGGVIGGDNPALGAALGGLIGGGVAAGVMTPLTGGDLGGNIFIGAMHGAMAAAFSAAMAQNAALSEADAELQEMAAGNGSPAGGYGPPDGSAPQSGAAPQSPYVQGGRVTEAGRKILQREFDRYNFDVRKIRVTFVHHLGQSGITLGDRILLDDSFQYRTPYFQMRLLAHEITHSVQYRDLGRANFLERYAVGFKLGRAINYTVPTELWAVPTEQLSVTQVGSFMAQDGFRYDFTLDQIANRIGVQAAAAVPYTE